MVISDHKPRLRAAIQLVLLRYARQVRKRPWHATASLLLPGIGNIFVFYVPPLAIAYLLGTLAADSQAPWSELATPVILLAGAWLVGEAIWRLAGFLLGRFEYHGIAALHIEAIARRARRQALRRATPAHRDRARDPQGRSDPRLR